MKKLLVSKLWFLEILADSCQRFWFPDIKYIFCGRQSFWFVFESIINCYKLYDQWIEHASAHFYNATYRQLIWSWPSSYLMVLSIWLTFEIILNYLTYQSAINFESKLNYFIKRKYSLCCEVKGLVKNNLSDFWSIPTNSSYVFYNCYL